MAFSPRSRSLQDRAGCADVPRISNYVACLQLGRARVLHLPGELIVEYQLAAKAARPDLFVAMAGLWRLRTRYIGTALLTNKGAMDNRYTAQLLQTWSPGRRVLDGKRFGKLLRRNWFPIDRQVMSAETQTFTASAPLPRRVRL
jgi:hypothetical protein